MIPAEVVVAVVLWLTVGLSVLGAWYVDEQCPPTPRSVAVLTILLGPLLMLGCVVGRWLKGGNTSKHPAWKDFD